MTMRGPHFKISLACVDEDRGWVSYHDHRMSFHTYRAARAAAQRLGDVWDGATILPLTRQAERFLQWLENSHVCARHCEQHPEEIPF